MQLSFIEIHAGLQLLAFMLFFPLGSIIALYRERIGYQWFRLHVIFQSLGTLCVALAVSFAIAHHRRENSVETESRIKRLHKANGYLIVSVLVFQWVWAVFARLYVPWNLWLNIHMILAAALIILAIGQITLGGIMFSEKNKEDK